MFGIFFSNADVEPHIDSLKGNNFFLKQSILELIQYKERILLIQLYNKKKKNWNKVNKSQYMYVTLGGAHI